ncbi:hypothetical protein CLV51_1021068 [Chitinophaga niastensis]|uniref:Methylamine utilisation protein MauE domain-containing protein n=1 Tax=Chitinophaga niastensis TaxID=536980 RepID=A0A2P8HPU2_CHINA|nr:MauE/DoxX family redox-associated membrane protein [Chitinophaga niastensis]PSL48204.1 hypothetical protein CLV51_1021068 [Chitinophaga niastensis]
MKRDTIVDVITYLLILLFVYTAATKLLLFGSFKVQMTQQPLPRVFVPVLIIGIPLIEILIACCLLIPRLKKTGLFASLFLMSAFTIYVGYMLVSVPHHSLPCSCGGIIKQMTWKQHLFFNLFYTLLAFTGVLLSSKWFQAKRDDLQEVKYT